MKFGILVFIWSLLFILYINIGGRVIVLCTLNHDIDTIYEYFSITKLSQYLTPIINIIFWMSFYFLFVVFIYMLKFVYYKGIKNYLKENTLISSITRSIYKLILYVLSFAFNDHLSRITIKPILLNFIIIALCCLFGKLGIIIASIYTIVIFIILLQKIKEVHQDYSILLSALKNLSDGDFNQEIEEDIGMFNSLKEEYSHIKEGFKIAVENEVKSQKLKTELISNVSHDLKTPLTAMITYTDLLKNNPDNPEYINILERNTLRLKHLIDDLFDVSKANSGNIQLDLIDIDLISIIKEAHLECQEYLDEKDLQIKYQIPDYKVILHLDSLKTFRIFENLFINISKYTLPHTRVYIDVVKNDKRIQITMKNISEKEMDFNGYEITERFIQGDKSRSHEGSGLGLAIVKSFVEIQNGEFYIELDGDLFKSVIVFYK